MSARGSEGTRETPRVAADAMIAVRASPTADPPHRAAGAQVLSEIASGSAVSRTAEGNERYRGGRCFSCRMEKTSTSSARRFTR
jgi:hypothetical protein